MKRLNLKRLLNLFVICLANEPSLCTRQIPNFCRRTCLPLILTIFLKLAGHTTWSQSILEIYLPAKNSTVEIFTFTRINPISGISTKDTFAGQGAGIFVLQIHNITLPGTGIIRNSNNDLREVFFAPGLPLTLLLNTNNSGINLNYSGIYTNHPERKTNHPDPNTNQEETNSNKVETNRNQATTKKRPGLINTNQPGESELISGAWRETDSVYRKMKAERGKDYMSRYSSADAVMTLKLYDSLLKTIDTVIAAQNRPLKDFLLYGLMRQAIDSSDQILMLNNYKMVYLPYLNQLAYGSFRNDIDRRYNYKLNLLISAQAGKPAPVFKLRDTTGKLHSLEDFKGKVVYVDLWASWCLPCRLETPYMHSIINKYGKRSDIAFIGISVGDRLQNWKRAIRQDKPRWLQLHDYNTFVANAYAVSSVPRYILIDKEGNVVEFNAPPPSEKSKLILMIDKALSDSDKD